MHEEGICLIKKDFKCPQINRETKIYNALGFVSQKKQVSIKVVWKCLLCPQNG